MKTPTIDEMRTMFRAHTEAALTVIVEIMTNGTGAKGEAVRLAAAKEILNRGWGRPTTYKDKESSQAERKPDGPSDWRSIDGKTYQQVYAEEAAKVAARAAAAPPPAPAVSVTAEPMSAPAAKPLPPAPPARDPDPTGYIARRAMWSGAGSASPPPAGTRGNGAAPTRR